MSRSLSTLLILNTGSVSTSELRKRFTRHLHLLGRSAWVSLGSFGFGWSKDVIRSCVVSAWGGLCVVSEVHWG